MLGQFLAAAGLQNARLVYLGLGNRSSDWKLWLRTMPLRNTKEYQGERCSAMKIRETLLTALKGDQMVHVIQGLRIRSHHFFISSLDSTFSNKAKDKSTKSNLLLQAMA